VGLLRLEKLLHDCCERNLLMFAIRRCPKPHKPVRWSVKGLGVALAAVSARSKVEQSKFDLIRLGTREQGILQCLQKDLIKNFC